MLDRIPFDPQILIFFVMMVLYGLRAIMERMKRSKGEQSDYPESYPQEEANDPMGEFRRMIEQAQREEQQRETEQEVIVSSAESLPSVLPEKFAPIIAQSVKVAKPVEQKHPVTTPRQASIAEMLRSPAAARQAIILQEVLGKPKGL